MGGLMASYISITRPSSSNDVYDPETDSWSKMAPIPIPVGGYASVVLDDKIYIISGAPEGQGFWPTNLVQIFDPQTNQWTNGTSIPVAVFLAGACVTKGVSAPKQIYVLGGATFYYYRLPLVGYDFNQVYDLGTDTWTNATAMPTPRYRLGVAVVNDEIYAIGGHNHGDIYEGPKVLVVNEKYTPLVDPIPEFFPWFILPLFLTGSAVVIILKRKLKN
jgi:N-acetylneuraminic acid mutarotase